MCKYEKHFGLLALISVAIPPFFYLVNCSEGVGIPEPAQIWYGNVVDNRGGEQQLLTEGVISWTITSDSLSPVHLSVELSLEHDGFSYLLRVPLETPFPPVLPLSPDTLALTDPPTTYDRSGVMLAGARLYMLNSQVMFTVAGGDRGKRERIDLYLADINNNNVPDVNAGEDVTLQLPADTVQLDGRVEDDGRPDPPGRVSVEWSKDSGPGNVIFGDITRLNTTARFSVAGDYVLRLTASDGELSGSDLISVSVRDDGDGSTKVEEVRVRASSDDAEERLSDGRVGVRSSDLELTNDRGVDQVVGIRFSSVKIPKGAEVKSAYLEFTVDEPGAGAAVFFIEAEATDNAAGFRSVTRNVSSRPRTTASARWAPGEWGLTGEAQKSADLSSVVQELVDREGWKSGNAMAFIITGAGNRVAVSWDKNAGAGGVPKLHVEYKVEEDPVVTLGPTDPFKAFNDLSWAQGQVSENITRYTTATGGAELPEGTGGLLVDYATGEFAPVTLEVVGGHWNGEVHATLGGRPAVGTDAFGVFDAKVDTLGVVSYGEDLELKLSGLNPLMNYRVVVYGNRARAKYVDRLSRTTLKGATFFVNESTLGSGFGGEQDASTVIANGYNTDEGYVARFSDVSSGPDGEIVVVVSDGGSPRPPQYYVSSICVEAYEPGDLEIAESQVKASSDDAEERLSDGRVGVRSSDLELTNDRGVDQVVGIRFSSVKIPKGAEVKSAYLEFTVDEPGAGAAVFFIEAEATDNAAGFRSVTRNVSSRPRTTASARWAPGEWGLTGEAQKSADLSSVVQELVDREGWKSGNAMAFIITGAGNRVAVSWDKNAGAGGVPKLHVEYKVEEDPVVTLGPTDPFKAFNDLSWAQGQVSENITRYTTATGGAELPEGTGGLLVDYATGEFAPVTLEVVGGHWNGEVHATLGGRPAVGTDAFGVFDAKVDTLGVVSYGEDLELKLSGLNPLMNYRVVVYGNRARAKYVDRLSRTTLKGATFFVNESTLGSGFGGEQDASTVIANGYNTDEGYVARFSDVSSGPDGEIVVVVSDGGSPRPPQYYVSSICVEAYEPGDLEIAESQVKASSDDAEERLSDGRVGVRSSDLELTNDRGVDQVVGIRFSSVKIPKGAEVKSAYLEFTVDEPGAGAAVFFIEAEATDNAAGFRSVTRNVSSRPRTTASARWAPGEWGLTGEAQKSADLSSVVQELVDREGWKSGNAMAFIITGAGNRVAVSWDKNAGAGGGVPKLHVEYEVGEDLGGLFVKERTPGSGYGGSADAPTDGKVSKKGNVDEAVGMGVLQPQRT